MFPDYNVLMVLPVRDFRDEEYEYTRQGLESNGVGIKIAAPHSGECYGVGRTVADADFGFEEIDPDIFDAIVFIGGPGVEPYFVDEQVLKLAKDFYGLGKVVAAICWAPVILINAGLIGAGKKATVWAGAKERLIEAGAEYSADPVVIDGKIVTANGPESASDFAQAIVGILQGA